MYLPTRLGFIFEHQILFEGYLAGRMNQKYLLVHGKSPSKTWSNKLRRPTQNHGQLLVERDLWSTKQDNDAPTWRKFGVGGFGGSLSEGKLWGQTPVRRWFFRMVAGWETKWLTVSFDVRNHGETRNSKHCGNREGGFYALDVHFEMFLSLQNAQLRQIWPRYNNHQWSEEIMVPDPLDGGAEECHGMVIGLNVWVSPSST